MDITQAIIQIQEAARVISSEMFLTTLQITVAAIAAVTITLLSTRAAEAPAVAVAPAALVHQAEAAEALHPCEDFK